MPAVAGARMLWHMEDSALRAALLIAPAGPGRSTVLRRWMARDERRAAWALLTDALAVAMGWSASGDLGVDEVEGWGEAETDALCLAQLALLAIEQDDWHGATLLIARARERVEAPAVPPSPAAALVLAIAAAADAHRGRVEDAVREVQRSDRVLAASRGLPPWYEVETRIALARTALRLSDVLRTRRLLAEASRLLRREPAAHVLRQRLDELWAQADAVADSAIGGGWSLTTAELRVLQLLPTHLSYPDIARRLFVSPNTVKTHARAVYRKLDASSRAEAVLRARDAGLLDMVTAAA